MLASYRKSLHAVFLMVFCLALRPGAKAQSNSASIGGIVLDPSGAVVANATVEIHNPVSHFDRSTATDNSGKFSFANVPFNPYHLNVTGQGFAPYDQDIDVRSVVPVTLDIKLRVAGSTESVTVEATGQDLLENDPTFHTDVDRGLFERLPLGKPVLVSKFAGYARHSRNRCGFQRSLSWLRGPCGKFVRRGRSADYRSTKQSLLQPDSGRCGGIHGSHIWSAACGIW